MWLLIQIRKDHQIVDQQAITHRCKIIRSPRLLKLISHFQRFNWRRTIPIDSRRNMSCQTATSLSIHSSIPRYLVLKKIQVRRQVSWSGNSTWTIETPRVDSQTPQAVTSKTWAVWPLVTAPQMTVKSQRKDWKSADRRNHSICYT